MSKRLINRMWHIDIAMTDMMTPQLRGFAQKIRAHVQGLFMNNLESVYGMSMVASSLEAILIGELVALRLAGAY